MNDKTYKVTFENNDRLIEYNLIVTNGQLKLLEYMEAQGEILDLRIVDEDEFTDLT